MIEKKKGKYRMDELWAILLFEVQFNQNNKKLGCDMMYTAERLKTLAVEQFRSQKSLTAIDLLREARANFGRIDQFPSRRARRVLLG